MRRKGNESYCQPVDIVGEAPLRKRLYLRPYTWGLDGGMPRQIRVPKPVSTAVIQTAPQQPLMSCQIYHKIPWKEHKQNVLHASGGSAVPAVPETRFQNRHWVARLRRPLCHAPSSARRKAVMSCCRDKKPNWTMARASVRCPKHACTKLLKASRLRFPSP